MSISDKTIEDLFRTCNRSINGFARRRVGREDAEDVVQDAYLRLLQLENDVEPAQARAYLFRLASSVSIDCMRKRKTRYGYLVDNIEVDGVDSEEGAHATAPGNVAAIYALQLCLARLPRCSRETFLLSRIYGMTYPEIAERLGISLRTVNRNMARAVERLHTALY